LLLRRPDEVGHGKINRKERATWRMPPLEDLTPARMTLASRVWMLALRGYLVVACGLVVVRVVQVALGNG
jgi:hypothetical protein